MKPTYLITGTGRCGTVYMARLLTSLGICCGHESIFDYRGIRWAEKRLNGEEPPELSYVSQTEYKNGKWVPLDRWLPDVGKLQAESSYMCAPFLMEPLLAGVPVIHVVRDPVKVVHSFCNYIDYFKSHVGANSYEQFIYRHIPELQLEMSQYDRACLYYVRWNEMIEKANPALFYRIEDDPQKVVDFLGKDGDYFKEGDVNSLKKPVNERFSIDKIQSRDIFDQFMAIGRRYGYRMKSEYLLI